MVSVAREYGAFNLLWIIEDDNKNFRAGRGQIGIVGIKTDGWVYEPNVQFFRWATRKNKLRAAVGFFQMIRYQKDIGVCLVKVLKKDSRYLYHLQKYGVLFPRGRIPMGSPQGDIYMFSINGMKNGD